MCPSRSSVAISAAANASPPGHTLHNVVLPAGCATLPSEKTRDRHDIKPTDPMRSSHVGVVADHVQGVSVWPSRPRSGLALGREERNWKRVRYRDRWLNRKKDLC
jgi:hypothetical protein